MPRVIALLVCCGIGAIAAAQDRQPPTINLRRDAAPPSLATTPEIWFYQQERDRHDDPQQAVRRKAETRSTQRQTRIQAMKWYGLSNSRPLATPTPLFGSYVSGWASNTTEPLRWRPAPARVVQRPSEPIY